jgi:rhodanese-related sulfurtransferase
MSHRAGDRILRILKGPASVRLLPYILVAVIAFGVPKPATGGFSLWLVEKRLELKYGVPNLSPEELKKRLSSEEAATYLLFDTRPKEEFEVSHIQSAIRIDPHLSAEAFMRVHGQRIKGKHLLFYCSVGDRSSAVTKRVQGPVLKAGAKSLWNLRGGIFRWYNEGNPVVNEKGDTNDIHPFNDQWGSLIERRKPAR